HRIDRMIGPLQDDGAAGLDRRQEADVERGRMPDRHADQVAVIAPVAHIEVDERGDLRDAAVGVHAALRRARRTRGVEDLGDLLIGEVAGTASSAASSLASKLSVASDSVSSQGMSGAPARAVSASSALTMPSRAPEWSIVYATSGACILWLTGTTV